MLFVNHSLNLNILSSKKESRKSEHVVVSEENRLTAVVLGNIMFTLNLIFFFSKCFLFIFLYVVYGTRMNGS